MTHPYYLDKAAAVWDRLGGPASADLNSIAEWGERASRRVDKYRGRVGILVTSDGQIVAETKRVQQPGNGADYVVATTDPDDPAGVRGVEAGLAAGYLGGHLGQKIVHIRVGVFTGAAR